jgi:hypothetical protein
MTHYFLVAKNEIVALKEVLAFWMPVLVLLWLVLLDKGAITNLF